MFGLPGTAHKHTSGVGTTLDYGGKKGDSRRDGELAEEVSWAQVCAVADDYVRQWENNISSDTLRG